MLLLVGKAENRQVHADLYQLTNSAVDLWLKRPVSSEEQNATLCELKSRMEYLTHHHRFTKEDQKCITLFHKCVLDVEKGIPPSPIKRKTYPKATAAQIISIEEIKRKHLEDPLGLSEILYPMAEMVYRGDYSSFLSAYEALSPHSKKDLTTHIDLCGGDLDQLKTDPPLSRDKKHEVKIAQGVLGYANAVMENKEEGILYPSFLTIHQMMLEISELDQET